MSMTKEEFKAMFKECFSIEITTVYSYVSFEIVDEDGETMCRADLYLDEIQNYLKD